MEINFFTQLSALQVKGNLIINVLFLNTETLVVSTFNQFEGYTDPAKHNLIPLVIKGTAEELNAGYFERIQMPLTKTAVMLDNVEKFLSQAKVTEANSKKEYEANKGYAEAIKKVNHHLQAGKFRDAYKAIPETKLYPTKEDELRKLREEISAKFDQPSLF